jgi:DNA-binding CsgD family transcriptional regulator
MKIIVEFESYDEFLEHMVRQVKRPAAEQPAEKPAIRIKEHPIFSEPKLTFDPAPQVETKTPGNKDIERECLLCQKTFSVHRASTQKSCDACFADYRQQRIREGIAQKSQPAAPTMAPDIDVPVTCKAPPSPFDDLTSTEKDNCALLLHGMTNTEIADYLDTHDTTATTHRRAIYSKLGAAGRDDLIRLAELHNFCHPAPERKARPLAAVSKKRPCEDCSEMFMPGNGLGRFCRDCKKIRQRRGGQAAGKKRWGSAK